MSRAFGLRCLAEYRVRRAIARNCVGKVIFLIIFESEFTPGGASYSMSMFHKLPSFLLDVSNVDGRCSEFFIVGKYDMFGDAISKVDCILRVVRKHWYYLFAPANS
ncbi:hypothetical protein AUC60_21990 [Pseudomonas caspiana]|uniref:Uncharacterized protein n=1 Tax=Pseudomonas caspiana TaxID=1451454 RepID=A0A1Y3NVJ9_9PSED|nr:hypothetical protein AUC60_21990 [Pseudomonas caspiana]